MSVAPPAQGSDRTVTVSISGYDNSRIETAIHQADSEAYWPGTTQPGTKDIVMFSIPTSVTRPVLRISTAWDDPLDERRIVDVPLY